MTLIWPWLWSQADVLAVEAEGRAGSAGALDEVRAEATFESGLTAVFETSRIADSPRPPHAACVFPSGEVEIDFLQRTFRNTIRRSSLDRRFCRQRGDGRDPLGRRPAQRLWLTGRRRSASMSAHSGRAMTPFGPLIWPWRSNKPERTFSGAGDDDVRSTDLIVGRLPPNAPPVTTHGSNKRCVVQDFHPARDVVRRRAEAAKAIRAEECSSAGRASVSKTEGRGFESPHSCHFVTRSGDARRRRSHIGFGSKSQAPKD